MLDFPLIRPLRGHLLPAGEKRPPGADSSVLQRFAALAGEGDGAAAGAPLPAGERVARAEPEPGEGAFRPGPEGHSRRQNARHPSLISGSTRLASCESDSCQPR